MLSVKNLVKIYQQGKDKKNKVVALNNVSIDFPEKGLVFLLGKSGSGKSTLLNAIGGLDSFDSGEIIIKGKSSKDFSQSDFDSYRNTFIGFIFQEYNILENFTVQKNLALALELQGKKVSKEEINKLLEQVDMLDYAKRKPNQLSGGQKQRVAIARALIKNPEIIMADEPTGALDSNTGKQVMETLKELSKEKLIIVVSHDRDFAETYGDRIIELKDGKIISDTTKKEVLATKTISGLSVVNDKYIHIKKGQKLTNEDFEIIKKQIQDNLSDSDTIISLDEEANKAVKKVESITDDGNQEAFLKTEPDDIEKLEYNGKNLKLIKSRLKFSDSFKMGASSLKNKVGKLFFTILLSFFAFTVFGIVDAFSCWNRADSVYGTMQKSGNTNIAFIKEKNVGTYSDSRVITNADINLINEEFPEYMIKPVAGATNYLSNNIYIDNYGSISTNNPLYTPAISGYVYFTEEDINSFGFDLEGRLPTNENEIAISKHIFESIKKCKEEITSWQGLRINTGKFDDYKTVVGIIDDHTNLSKYTNMTENELMNNSYNIQQFMNYNFTNLAYVSEPVFNEISSEGITAYYYLTVGETNLGYQFNKDEIRTNEDVYEEYGYDGSYYNSYAEFLGLSYYKDGVINPDGTLNLGKNEIIVSEYVLNNILDYESKLQEGLTITVSFDYEGTEKVAEFTVVGIMNRYSYLCSQDTFNSSVAPLFSGYEFAVTTLTGTDSDREFVRFLENYNDENIRYTIQSDATSTLNMFESMLSSVTSVFLYVAIAFAVFASLLLMNFISTSISYKKREIGVLRALGARGSDVFGIFFNESMVIALINFALAAIATFVGCTLINSSIIAELGISIYFLNFSIRQVLIILAVSVGTAFLASLLPVVKISRKKPIDAINNR